MHPREAFLIFPHQLFKIHLKRPKSTTFILIEDERFFQSFPFAKQKLVLHRASMQALRERLLVKGYQAEYIEAKRGLAGALSFMKDEKIESVSYYELIDAELDAVVTQSLQEYKRTVLPSPAFVSSETYLRQFFSKNPLEKMPLYIDMRKRLKLLVDMAGRPEGGKWIFIPKEVSLPAEYQLPEVGAPEESRYVDEAIEYVEHHFPTNPGVAHPFHYPVTFADAEDWLEDFLENRLKGYAQFADQILVGEVVLHHSLLSFLLNIGLLTPEQVIAKTLQHTKKYRVSLQDLERFFRNILGEREFIRAHDLIERKNLPNPKLVPLSPKILQAKTGNKLADALLKQVAAIAYCSEQEREFLAEALKFPDEAAISWHLSLFIDAYSWNTRTRF